MKLNSRSISAILIFFIPLVFLLGIVCLFIDKTDQFNDLETVFKVIALYAAFWFFIYKLFTGWLIINLTVDLETERITGENGLDYLAVHVLLSKGRTDSVWLKDIVINVKTCPGVPDEMAIHAASTNPVLIRPVGINRTLQHDQTWQPEAGNRLLNISPEEGTRFSAFTCVPTGHVVILEAIVLGTRPFYSIEKAKDEPIQWKASKIVLPKGR
ncbi:hypothetical protein ACUN24_20530 [Pedobacter sp. WC2501]|uniref:hypothetical protein n=1 Tax=Pedobacter sp. WC2501 TaxID=3461400 RepID=UPI004045F749